MENKAVSGMMLTLLLMSILLATFVIREASASPAVRIYVHMPLGYIPGVPPGPLPGSLVFVDLYIDTDIPDNTPQGIYLWAISARVDPSVLEPMGVQGAQPGYFLDDFLVRYGYNLTGYNTEILNVIDKAAGEIYWIAEGCMPIPPTGAGAVPGQMPYKLCTLIFKSLSETAYSPIDLYYEVGVDAWYWTVETKTAIPVDIVEDGQYNFPVTDFDIVVSPSTDITARGTTVTTNVYVSAIAGYDHLVSLSASGQPEGITINFNPSTGTPDFTSTMTIQVGYTVPSNTYPITVTGLGSDGTTHSTTYTLTVTTVAVPEFPLGLTLEILFIPVIIYILWKTKQRKKVLP